MFFKFYLTTFTLALASRGVSGQTQPLPSWITENPGYRESKEIDSIETGNGSISTKEKKSQGWLVFLNEKAGHGIELELTKLSIDPNEDDFLLISSWPLTSDLKQIKLLTGQFDKPSKKIRIPNTKMFFLLYSVSQRTESPEMALTYRRYGLSLELNPLPTENPIKKKDTVFEVQLKGKPPEEYSDADFIKKLKTQIRAAARRYAIANKIPFDEEITTENMVFFHKITSCPFEWPEREICASIKHSVFISGVRIPDEEIILDYQLTSDHLRVMWSENIPELQELGIIVFELPTTYSTVFYWMGIVGLTIIVSLTCTFLCWRMSSMRETSFDEDSRTFEEVKATKRPKLQLSKHQRVPSFMYNESVGKQKQKEPVLQSEKDGVLMKDDFDDILKPGDSSGLPIKSYIGSILFSSNKAYEMDA